MKKLFLILASAVVLSSAAFGEEIMYVTSPDGLRVRSEPSLSAKTINALYYGEYMLVDKIGELATPRTALFFVYSLIPLAALTALVERTKDGHRIVIARRVLAAYLALDILSGILGIWLYDVYAFSLFVPFYSRFALAINANIVRYQSYGYLPAFDMLLRYVYYIAYWLNFALLLRSLSKRIRQGEQTEESQ